jgi:hypothetical protein
MNDLPALQMLTFGRIVLFANLCWKSSFVCLKGKLRLSTPKWDIAASCVWILIINIVICNLVHGAIQSGSLVPEASVLCLSIARPCTVSHLGV